LVENKDSPFPPSMKEGQKLILKEVVVKDELLKSSSKLDK
jgi:hypothetical protein